MVLALLKNIKRVQSSWDPVPAAYAKSYADKMYSSTIDYSFLHDIEKEIDKNRFLTLLDLGGGPGHHSIEFAKRGYRVKWHDISKNYLQIARQMAKRARVSIDFSLGYLEDAQGRYDIVFNSQCWYYCINDFKFARKLLTLVKKNGIIYAIINNELFLRKQNAHSNTLLRWTRILQFLLNEYFDFKIGHIFPSHDKIINIFKKLDKIYKFQKCNIYRSGHFTVLLLKK